MPLIETPDELAEIIADWCGIYGNIPNGQHVGNCKCRLCFVIVVAARIRRSVENERILKAIADDRHRSSSTT